MRSLILARFVEGHVIGRLPLPALRPSNLLLFYCPSLSNALFILAFLIFLFSPLRLLPLLLSLPLPRLDRGTSASPSLFFPVLLSCGHVIFRPPRAPTRPPLFSSPALLFCSPTLYPLPSPHLLNHLLSQYPCFPFSLSLSPSSIRTPFLSSPPPLLYSTLPLFPPPLLLSSTFSHFPEIRSISVIPPIFHLPARQPQPF